MIVRCTIFVLYDGFTINDRGLAAEIGSSANNAGIAVGPVKSVAGEDPTLTALDHHERAVSIMFDLMNPMPPLRRLIDQRGKLRLDEPERCGCPRHMRRTV
jgi:hypothetical protein